MIIRSPQTITVAQPRSAREKNNEAVVSALLHAGTTHRALDRIQVLRENFVDPENMQRYRNRWASWWGRRLLEI
jgi:hypothetical protein